MSPSRSRRALALVPLAVLGCGAEEEAAPPAARAPAEEAAAPEEARAAAGGDAGSGGPWFTDVTGEWGFDYVHDAGFTPEKHLPETMGGGVLLFDADGDGDADVYFVQSGSVPVPAAEPRDASEPANRLYRNDGAGRFTDATAESGDGAHRGYGQGAAAGDADGDGDQDLYVTNFGPDALLSNDGTGRFEETTARAGLGEPRWTSGCVFFDADVDGDLDLYVTGYVQVDVEHPPWCGRREPGWRSYCHPDHYPGLADRFWRNRGDGTFVDATAGAGLADNLGKGLCALASDVDADGDPDLYVANDSVENKFWRNDGDGTFTDDTLVTGTGVDGRGATEAGMGLASGDVDGDLDLDLFVTNFDDESNTLYRNDGPLFTDATAPLGLDAPSRLPVGFGTVLEDFDADGDLDLAVANGHIIDNIELYHDGKTWAQPAHLYVNESGRFRIAPREAGDLDLRDFVGRGLASGDLDGDGDADLVLAQCGGDARVYRNDAGGPLLVVRGLPRGTLVVANSARGRILREAGPQPTYYGQTDGLVRVPASIGGAPVTGLELLLPGGERETWSELPAAPALLEPRAEGGFRTR